MSESARVHHADVVVVGAGVIGLSIGAKFASLGHKVIVLERNSDIGLGISGLGSNVVHSGLYYPENSLKKRFCIEGQALLYDYCRRKSIPHNICGKLVVATSSDELEKLQLVCSQAQRNGVEAISWLETQDVRKIEPALEVAAALYVPKTGIVDGMRYLKSLRAEVEDSPGTVLFNHRVLQVRRQKSRFFVETGTSDGVIEFAAEKLILAGGLGSHTLAKCIEGYDLSRLPAAVYVKGSYFRYASNARPFSHLVYPVPVEGGLGIHLTMNLAGQICFGPDVEWLTVSDESQIDFSVDPARQKQFYSAIRRYWPGLGEGALIPDRASVRPQLSHPDKSYADFLVQTSVDHGVDRLVALFGIESPGLTSSLAIANYITATLA